MGGPKNKALKYDFGAHVAVGGSIQAFCDKTGVSVSTLYRWRKEPGVIEVIDRCRAEYRDRLIGKTVSRSAWAMDNITALARDSKSDAVRFAASREMLVQFNAMDFKDHEQRIRELEEKRKRDETQHRRS